MNHIVGRILGQPDDYIVCVACGGINWYENEACVSCRKEQFRPFNDADVLRLEEGLVENHDEYADGGLCDECEIEV